MPLSRLFAGPNTLSGSLSNSYSSLRHFRGTFVSGLFRLPPSFFESNFGFRDKHIFMRFCLCGSDGFFHDVPLTVSSTLSFPGSPLLWLNRLDHLTWLKGRLAEVVATNGTLLRSWDGPCGDAPVNGDRKNLAVDG